MATNDDKGDQAQIDRLVKQVAYVLSSEDRIKQAIVDEVAKINDAWRIHRDVMNRAVNLLNHEVINLIDRTDKEDRQRAERQGKLDNTLERITRELRRVRRWQWIRIIAEVVLILIVAAYLYGLWS